MHSWFWLVQLQSKFKKAQASYQFCYRCSEFQVLHQALKCVVSAAHSLVSKVSPVIMSCWVLHCACDTRNAILFMCLQASSFLLENVHHRWFSSPMTYYLPWCNKVCEREWMKDCWRFKCTMLWVLHDPVTNNPEILSTYFNHTHKSDTPWTLFFTAHSRNMHSAWDCLLLERKSNRSCGKTAMHM